MNKSQAFSPTRAVSSAWDLLMKAPLPLWVGGLILVVVQSLGSVGGGGDIHLDGSEPGKLLWLLIPVFLFGLGLALVVMGVTSWLKVGYYGGVRAVMQDGDVPFERLYKAEGRWLTVFLTLLLQLGLTIAAFLPMVLVIVVAALLGEAAGFQDGALAGLIIVAAVFYLPVLIYIALGLMLMPYPAALDGFSPVQSMRESWALASGVRWELFLMGLLQVALSLAGLAMCCVGVLPAGILIEVMWCEAYIQATREDRGGDWWVDHKGRGRPVAPAQEWDEARQVEAQPAERFPQDPGAPEPPAQGFDPGGWRGPEDEPRA